MAKQKLYKRMTDKGLKPYPNGGMVSNPYSGETIELNGMELSVYDLLLGAEGYQDYSLLNMCREWFMKYKIDAYMTLID